jgi:hypothetical protein
MAGILQRLQARLPRVIASEHHHVVGGSAPLAGELPRSLGSRWVEVFERPTASTGGNGIRQVLSLELLFGSVSRGTTEGPQAWVTPTRSTAGKMPANRRNGRVMLLPVPAFKRSTSCPFICASHGIEVDASRQFPDRVRTRRPYVDRSHVQIDLRDFARARQPGGDEVVASATAPQLENPDPDPQPGRAGRARRGGGVRDPLRADAAPGPRPRAHRSLSSERAVRTPQPHQPLSCSNVPAGRWKFGLNVSDRCQAPDPPLCVKPGW